MKFAAARQPSEKHLGSYSSNSEHVLYPKIFYPTRNLRKKFKTTKADDSFFSEDDILSKLTDNRLEPKDMSDI